MTNKKIIGLTKSLIKFKSVSNDTAECHKILDFVEQYLADTPNIKVARFESNGHPSLVATLAKTKTVKCFLYSHLDIVDAKAIDFKPKIDGDKLYGRGSGDMKAVAAASIIAFMQAAQNRNHDLGLMLTTDEEIGGENGAKYLLNKCGYKSDLVIIPDNGTSLANLIINQKGILMVRVVTTGTACHGSRPWLGDNAINKLIRKLQILQKKHPNKKTGTTINLGKLNAGDQINKVPDFAEAYLDIRYENEKSRAKIIKTLNRLFPNHFELVMSAQPFNITPHNKYLLSFKKILASHLKEKVKLTTETGGSDARFFSEKGIAAIVTGIKKGNTHGEQEWCSLKEVEIFYQVLLSFIGKLAHM